jgi:hypothetical protein
VLRLGRWRVLGPAGTTGATGASGAAGTSGPSGTSGAAVICENNGWRLLLTGAARLELEDGHGRRRVYEGAAVTLRMGKEGVRLE